MRRDFLELPEKLTVLVLLLKLLTPLPRAATQASLLPGPAQTSPLPGAAAPPFPLTLAAASLQPIYLLASLPGPVMMSSRKYLKS